MRVILNGMVVFTLVFCAGFAAYAQGDFQSEQIQQPAFLSALTDIPLMNGLEELSEEAFVFDKPGGRIVDATAVGKAVSPATIELFYNQTLPHLGWERIAPNSFVRQGESLDIEVFEREKYGVIRFSVKPR